MIEACEDVEEDDEGEGEGEGAEKLTGENATEMVHAITGIVGSEVFADP